MPVITIETPILTKGQKEQLVKEMVTVASKILNLPQQAFTTIIRENNLDNIGNGTKVLSNNQNQY